MGIQLQIVTKKQAIKLKQLGFEWECEYWISDNDEPILGKLENWNGLNNNEKRLYATSSEIYSAPTVPLAIKWLRDTKGFNIDINYHPNVKKYWLAIYDVDKIINVCNARIDSYEQAESDALDFVLSYLLEKK